MIFIVVASLALVGGTTWLALEEPMARRAVLHHRLTGAGLLLCLVSGIAVIAVAVASMA